MRSSAGGGAALGAREEALCAIDAADAASIASAAAHAAQILPFFTEVMAAISRSDAISVRSFVQLEAPYSTDGNSRLHGRSSGSAFKLSRHPPRMWCATSGNLT